MSYKISVFPGTYIFEKDLLHKAYRYMHGFKNKGMIIGERFIINKFATGLRSGFRRKMLYPGYFEQECCERAVDLSVKACLKKRAGFIVGIGGGKALDTAKIVAYRCRLPVINIPTSAATCAAVTALSALYSDEGEFLRYVYFERSPDIVLADKNIIASSPARLLAAGMADALAKYYESETYTRGKKTSLSVATALKISSDIHKEVYRLGAKAFNDCKTSRFSDEVERMIECNIFMAGLVSGIGGEGCRAASVHALTNGFTKLDKCRELLHGEIVAFCNLIHLLLEGKDREFVRAVKFYRKTSLPLSMDKMGLRYATEKDLHKVLKHAFSRKETMGNMSEPVSVRDVKDAIRRLT